MGKLSIRRAIGALTIGLALLAAGPLSAGVILTTHASTTGQNPVYTGDGTSSGAAIFSSIAGSGNLDTGSAKAIALIGTLGAEARATEFGASNVLYTGSATYSDDVVFSGPGTDPILVQLILHFSGSLSATNEAGSNAKASAGIGGQDGGSLIVADSGGVLSSSGTFSGLGGSGPSYDSTLTGLAVLVPLNSPVTISLSLETDADAFGFSTLGTSLFSNTFGFVTGEPLFNLPNGYTVNSPTSFIVDNRFTPPGEAVPEPSTLAMSSILLAMFGVVWACKRLKRPAVAF